MLLERIQIDGSDHAWFEDRAEACTLLVYIYDATSRLMQLHFVPTESTFAYFEATRATWSDTASRSRSTATRQPCSLPGAREWGLLCLMGFMGTVGHSFLILAHQRAPALTLTPYFYAQIAFAIGGWLVFSYVPDPTSLVGMALIAICGAAGAWLTVRERHQPIEPAGS